MEYIVKENFVDGVDKQSGDSLFRKKGDVCELEDAAAAQLLADGLIMKKDDLNLAQLADLEKKVKAKKDELLDLEAQCQKLKLLLPKSDAGEKAQSGKGKKG